MRPRECRGCGRTHALPSRRSVLSPLACAVVAGPFLAATAAAQFTDDDERFMRMAIEQARIADFPFGAVIVKDGKVMARGRNMGRTLDDPTAHCFVPGVPRAIYTPSPLQILQTPEYVVLLFERMSWRIIPLNRTTHIPDNIRLWQGDSIGHFEGDALVVDTVGIKVGPFAAVDWYGTPHTEALHVVERYRLIDYEAAKEGWARDAKENWRAQPAPNYRGKYLQLQFTVDDAGAFTTPWTATMTYGRSRGDWAEAVCAENIMWYSGQEAAVPRANKPDF